MRRSTALALSLFGLFDSLYLWWTYTSPNVPIVCLGSGCDEVRASRFAHLLGVPTPAYGIALYSLLAALIFAEPLVRISLAAWLRRALVVVAAAGFLAGFALTLVEAFVIHHYCSWCVAQFVAVTLILILSLLGFRQRVNAEATAALAVVRVQSLILLAAVIAGVPSFIALMKHTAKSTKLTAVHQVATIPENLVRPDSHVFGNAQAPLTIVEFGDFQCPSCVLSEPTSERIRQAYKDRARFVFRQFPLTMIHGYAQKAAEASECAADQGKFWEAVHQLYDANGELTVPALKHYAREIGLNGPKFDQCLDSSATAVRVRRDYDDGRAIGVHATPTFFVGQQQFAGAWDYDRFAHLIDSELARVGAAPVSTASNAQPVAVPTESKPVPSQPASTAKARNDVPAKQATSHPDTTGAPTTSAPLSLGTSATNAFGIGQSSGTDCDLNVEKQQQPDLIRTPEAQKLFGHGTGTVFVDVRSPSDFQQGRIRGAMNVPADQVSARINALPKNKTIVLYESGRATGSDICAASRAAGRILLSHGFHDVKVYEDGLAAWQKQGLPVER